MQHRRSDAARAKLQAKPLIDALVGFETLFQLICPEAREKRRKIALRCDARILIDYQKLFLIITPGRPIGQARSVWVTSVPHSALATLRVESPSLKQAAIRGSHADGN